MNMYDLIQKKRDGFTLTTEEIKYVVSAYTKGEIKDYQMSAFLMAVYFQKMNKQETVDLTLAMASSGEMLDLSRIHGVKVDKHSTGGIGDKTTLILAPMLAALNIPVAKMSGRGLGYTGGTIDKLESFPGFSTSVTKENFIENVNRHYICVAGQTENLAPADKKIYALRDVTATVDNISLIASSIMSKKLASGADAIVLDVKCGTGAFMKKEEDAVLLAKTMVQIGEDAGRKTVALITDMNQPLGRMVGNSLEVQEAISVLKGEGDERLRELSLQLAAWMMVSGGYEKEIPYAYERVKNTIDKHLALDKMAMWVESQGGNKESVYEGTGLKKASRQKKVYAEEDGFLYCVDATEVGKAALVLGAGRVQKEDKIDLGAGIELLAQDGEWVEKGKAFAILHYEEEEKALQAEKILKKAYEIKNAKMDSKALIKKVITIKEC
ncbi:MAG: thymidine phosphorylase [Lachnospiraceae bacterium]|nr:thymidine phosphorylase [Lachnospiraceae bacterium]